MATTQASAQPEMATITEPMRRFSLISQKSSRASSWRDGSATSSTTGSRTTVGSSSNSSRPSVSESGRRRTSLASFSSLLKKSKRPTSTVSEENNSSKRNGRVLTLGERFLNLPAEIQTIILAYLSIPELLSFRRISKSCLAILQANSSTITRNALQTPQENEDYEGPADFLLHLYPSTFSSTTTDAYFLRTLRRKAIIARQLQVVITFIQTRVYMMKLTRELECEHFGPYRPGLRARLYHPIGHFQHLLENICHLILQSHPSHPSPNLTIDICPPCISSLKSVIATYPSPLLLPIYQVIQLLVQHFRAATRSPSSVTAFERKLRGWGYGPPPEEHTSQLFFLGGIHELSKIDEMQGSYSRRLSIVKSFADTLAEATRINSIAFPDIYKTRADPVMAPSRLSGRVSKDKYRENIRTAIEARADDQLITKSLGVNLNVLTDEMLASVPRIDSLLVGPNTLLGKRIIKERLVEHERELLSPYGFLIKLMAESYSPDDARAARPDARNDAEDLVGGDGHDHDYGGGGITGHWDAGGNGGGDGGGGGGG